MMALAYFLEESQLSSWKALSKADFVKQIRANNPLELMIMTSGVRARSALVTPPSQKIH
jgi:hypothetical protein